MLEESISSIPGVGPKRQYFLNKLGLFNKRDVLFFLPFKYLSLTNHIQTGFSLIKVKVKSKIKCSPKFFKIIVMFDQVEIHLHFFHVTFFNIFILDNEYYLSGEIFLKDNVYYMISPNILTVTSPIVPIYKGVSSYLFSGLVLKVINELDNQEIIYHNLTLKKIFFNLHNGLEVVNSLEALKYLEASFLYFVFSVKDPPQKKFLVSLDKALESFPYKLSTQQKLLCTKVEYELNHNMPLKYFVYGEVGAGKTLISIVTIMMLLNAGYTSVMLVPTVALAHQHYEEMLKIMPNLSDDILLLTGLSKNKKDLKTQIELSKYKIIIGTHALMHLRNIPNLGLVVIDEIHKFGVVQRSKLIANAVVKNLLMLTATPIPRSLSMIMNNFMKYGMLESFKQKNTITLWVQIERKMQLLSKFEGKKVYWILPNINENEKNDGVEKRFQQLKDLLPKVFMLHGQMKDKDKIDIINNFKNTNVGLLVATTVIEIGINIPDADIIVIENAERFGLAQLHQLRGRVGRMGQLSFCILLSQYQTKKMQYMKAYRNGFDISERDLELRGGGKITGFLQHGCESFYFLTENDEALVEQAISKKERFEAFSLFSKVDINC